tara:strand:+ start:819 stop:941 length:123 start_codon:yes stop_codon:yes gene_type:complete
MLQVQALRKNRLRMFAMLAGLAIKRHKNGKVCLEFLFLEN